MSCVIWYSFPFAEKRRWLVRCLLSNPPLVQWIKGRIYIFVNLCPVLQHHQGNIWWHSSQTAEEATSGHWWDSLTCQSMLQSPDFILNLTYNLGFGEDFEVWEKNQRDIAPETKVHIFLWTFYKFLLSEDTAPFEDVEVFTRRSSSSFCYGAGTKKDATNSGYKRPTQEDWCWINWRQWWKQKRVY